MADPNREIGFGFVSCSCRACVRAGEAKLRERARDKVFSSLVARLARCAAPRWCHLDLRDPLFVTGSRVLRNMSRFGMTGSRAVKEMLRIWLTVSRVSKELLENVKVWHDSLQGFNENVTILADGLQGFKGIFGKCQGWA